MIPEKTFVRTKPLPPSLCRLALMLEAVIAMPTQKMWMRPFRTARGWKRATRLVYECAHGLLIIDLTRNHNFQIVGQRDESAIKHPVGGTGKRYSITDNIGAAFLDWTDMRSIHLCTTAAVDKSKPCDGATLVICAQDNASKNTIPDDPRNSDAHAVPILIILERDLRHVPESGS